MRFNNILFILVVISFCGLEGSCQEIKNPKYQEAILEGHRLIDSLQQNQKIPGIDVAVSINGEIVWSEGFGFADLEHSVPVRPGKTRFRIGSVSKPLTSAALGILMDREKINLNAPVQTYVPYFPIKKYPVTVKQVGGHIAGIRHYQGNEHLEKEHYKTVKSDISIFESDSYCLSREVSFLIPPMDLIY